MGQLIDFSGGSKKQTSQSVQHSDIIDLLPKLKVFKGETIVIDIDNSVLTDDVCLAKVIKEIVILKYIGAFVVVTVNFDDIVKKHFDESLNEKIFINEKYAKINGSIDIIEVLIKHNISKKIAPLLQQYDIMSMIVSGNDLNVVFPDDVVNTNVSSFNFLQRSINTNFQKQFKKYSVDMLNEIIKTDILPILIPTYKDKQSNEYVMTSGMFSMYLSKYLGALKYITLYRGNDIVPRCCIYGVERFVKLIKTGSFDDNSVLLLNPAIEAVKNDVQSASIIDIDSVSILEEICSSQPRGLLLYNDALQHI